LGELWGKGLGVLFSQVAEVPAQDDEVLGFGQRALRDVEKASVLCIALPLGAFGDVGGNRDRRATQLRRDAIALVARKTARQTIDLEHRFVCLLPNLQLSELLHSFPLVRLSTFDLRRSSFDALPSTLFLRP